ncbi:hypothetical protein [Microbispora sp. CA-102843]|uniref:hypothetical protein n=1 Tax=Microbispora sp. CA-102843 TaxID=3239952 RepID=UPI003D9142A4
MDIDGVQADLASSCQSQYRAERGHDGVWRITRITSIYEKDTLTPALPNTHLAIDPRCGHAVGHGQGRRLGLRLPARR